MQNPYANVFLCTGCKSSNGKWKKIFAQCQQLHHEVADLAPVRAMPPDEKQACIEDFFLSSARLPDTQPSSPSAEQRLSACRFAVSAAEHYDDLSSTQYADMHWHVPTALDEPGFISARQSLVLANLLQHTARHTHLFQRPDGRRHNPSPREQR